MRLALITALCLAATAPVWAQTVIVPVGPTPPSAGPSVVTVSPDPNHPILSQGFQDQIDLLTGSPVTAGNRFELLEDGVRAFPRKLDLVRGARSSLFMTTMIMKLDTTGTLFADALIAAAARGVDVRCIIDSFYTSETVFRRLENGGVKVARYNPAFHYGRAGRLHQKMVIADLRTAVVGGLNMDDDYNLGDGWNDEYHDTDVLVDGDGAAEAARWFLTLWLEHRPYDAVALNTLSMAPTWSRLIPASPTQRLGFARWISQDSDRNQFFIRDTYERCFDAADTQILWYTNNLNIAPGPLLNSLRRAVTRGVRVALITNSLEASLRRVGLGGWFQYVYLKFIRWLRLRQTGIEVWETPVPIHTKVMTVDGVMAAIGSYNYSRTSQKNMESTYVVYDPIVVRDAEFLIEFDLLRSRRTQ